MGYDVLEGRGIGLSESTTLSNPRHRGGEDVPLRPVTYPLVTASVEIGLHHAPPSLEAGLQLRPPSSSSGDWSRSAEDF